MTYKEELIEKLHDWINNLDEEALEQSIHE